MIWSIRNFYYFTIVLVFIVVSVATGLYIFGEKNSRLSAVEENGEVINDTKNVMNIDTSEKKSMQQNKYNLPKDAFILHFNALTADTHNDFLYQMVKKDADFAAEEGFTQSGLSRLIKGGIKVQLFACWIPQENFNESKNYVLREIKLLDSLSKNNPGSFLLAKSPEDIDNIVSQGKLAGLIGIEGGTAVEGNLENIDKYYSLGVRYITLTWNNSNDIGSSAKDEEEGKRAGLTEFGKKVVKRMNGLGMLVDVSHLGEKSFWDIMEVSDKPVIASHSCCRALNPIARNLSDEQIKAIAKSGGIVMINFHSPFLNKNAKKKYPLANQVYANQLNKIYEKYGNDRLKYNEERYAFLQSHRPKNGSATLDDVVAHIEHIINLVGADYVGLGSDYDGGINPPFDLYDATCYPFITKKLAEKGYPESDIRKILGLNFLRVLKSVTGGKF